MSRDFEKNFPLSSATADRWLTDDTWPGGPCTVGRTCKAPFARASREDDYRIAWAFFESNQQAAETA